MKNLLFKSVSAFTMAALMAVGLNAQPPGAGKGPGYCRNLNTPALNLSDEQQEAMKALRIDHLKKVEPLKNKMAELKAQQRTLMSVENVDMKLVNKNIDDQTALMNQMQKLQAGHRLAVKEILTDEQEILLSRKTGKEWQPGLYCRGPQGPHGPRGPQGNCPYRGM